MSHWWNRKVEPELQAPEPEPKVEMDREQYIRLLVDGYRQIDKPIPEWLQHEWNEMGLVEPEPPPENTLFAPEEIQVWVVMDIGQHREEAIQLFPENGKWVATAVAYSGVATKALLRNRDGNLLGEVSLSRDVPITAGDTFSLHLNS